MILRAPSNEPRRTLQLALLAWLALFSGIGVAQALVGVPALVGRVQDGAGLLSSEEEQSLSSRLAQFESETRHQVVVLTLPSLEGEAIERFSLRVAEAWKIGQADFDNGIIVVVAAKDRLARIEVGYGLEGVVPDATAARILRDYMIPEFKAGAMGRGVERGVEAILAAARNEALPATTDRAGRNGRRNDDPVGGLLFATIFGSMFGAGVGRKRRWLGALIGGAVAGGVGFLITLSLAMAAGAALLGSLLGLFIATESGRSSSVARGGYYPGSGGFGGGGLGGGGFGGGFGGGGGGFGGGGASGGW